MDVKISDKRLEELEALCKRSPLHAWSNGRNRIEQEPWLVYIGITNACNYRCLVCARKDVMRKEVGMMDFTLFTEIVDKLPEGVRRIYLMKQGETLLHPKLPEMLKYLKGKRPDIEVALHTNAAKLNRELSKTIAMYVDFFAVSIFSIYPDTYKKVHGKDNFDLVIRNVKTFLKVKEELQSDVKMFVDYVRQDDNVRETDEMVFTFFAREFPGFSVGIHWCANFLGFGEQGHLDIYDRLPYDQFPRCVFPWVSFTICWDGLVDYCFVEPEEKCFLGDIKNRSITEIWNDGRYREFRQLLLERDFDALDNKGIRCRKCSWLWGLKNQPIENLVRGVERQGDQNVTEPIITGEEYLLEGFRNYLRGELANAYQNFHLSKIISKNEALKNKAEEWVDNVEKIYKLNRNTEIWEDFLNKEGKSLKDINITRYNDQIGPGKCS